MNIIIHNTITYKGELSQPLLLYCKVQSTQKLPLHKILTWDTLVKTCHQCLQNSHKYTSTLYYLTAHSVFPITNVFNTPTALRNTSWKYCQSNSPSNCPELVAPIWELPLGHKCLLSWSLSTMLAHQKVCTMMLPLVLHVYMFQTITSHACTLLAAQAHAHKINLAHCKLSGGLGPCQCHYATSQIWPHSTLPPICNPVILCQACHNPISFPT